MYPNKVNFINKIASHNDVEGSKLNGLITVFRIRFLLLDFHLLKFSINLEDLRNSC